MTTAPYLAHGRSIDLATFRTIVPGDPVDVARDRLEHSARRAAWRHCTPADADPVVEVRRDGDTLTAFTACRSGQE